MIPVKTVGLNEEGKFIQEEISMEEYRKACAHHYRDTEEFFGLFLDKDYMGYSCGWFEKDDYTLEQAMLRKYVAFNEMILQDEPIKILEVGSGFGGLSRFLALCGHDVNAYNISKTQHAYCVKNSVWKSIYHFLISINAVKQASYCIVSLSITISLASSSNQLASI